MRLGATDEVIVAYIARSTALGRAVATRLEQESELLSVSATTDPLEGTELLTRADCVVSCYALGSTTGVALLERLRGIAPGTPFVLSPVDDRDSIKADAAEARVEAYVPLPTSDTEWALLATQLEQLGTEHTPTEANDDTGGRAGAQADDRGGTIGMVPDDQQGVAYRCRLQDDRTMEFLSPGTMQLTGYAPERFVLGELDWTELIHPDDQRTVQTEIETAVANDEPFRVSYRIRTADGDDRWVREHGHTVGYTEEGPLLEGRIVDVTDRYQPGEASTLKDRAMDEAAIGIVITDATRPDNPVVYANEGFEKLTGYDRLDVIGRNCQFLQGPETPSEPVERMREAIDNEEPVTVDVLNYRKDGTRFWNRVQIAPLENDAGEVTHFVGFLLDGTTNIEREQRLHLLHRVLRHNLRNAMNVVLGRTQQLAEQIENENQRDAVESITNASQELLRISKRARGLERLLSEEHALDSTPIRELLDPVVEEFRATYEDVEIALALPRQTEAEVIVDQRLQHAFRELLTNAIDHTDQAEPRVEIDVAVPDEGEAVQIDVRDNGPGLPEQEQVVLTSGQESPLQHGTGFGLWLVHWLVRLSGGHVSYRDNDPRGSVITVELRQPQERSLAVDSPQSAPE